ncbi:MAG: hypothetical protein ACXITR_11740 [Cyanobacterium sp.]
MTLTYLLIAEKSSPHRSHLPNSQREGILNLAPQLGHLDNSFKS